MSDTQEPYVWYKPEDSTYRVMDVPESDGRMVEFIDGFGNRKAVFVPNGASAGSGNPPWTWYTAGYNSNPRALDIPGSSGRVMEFYDGQRGREYVFVPDSGTGTGGDGGTGGETPPASTGAFWFTNLSGDIADDDTWHPITMLGGGMTGDASLATADDSGLTLLVECVVQVKIWAEFATAGTGVEQIGVQLDETGIGGNVRYRGQLQMNIGETMVASMYDGWLNAGVIIGAGARSTALATINSNSYATAVITRAGA